jgi:hypothetical protein
MAKKGIIVTHWEENECSFRHARMGNLQGLCGYLEITIKDNVQVDISWTVALLLHSPQVGFNLFEFGEELLRAVGS